MRSKSQSNLSLLHISLRSSFPQILSVNFVYQFYLYFNINSYVMPGAVLYGASLGVFVGGTLRHPSLAPVLFQGGDKTKFQS